MNGKPKRRRLLVFLAVVAFAVIAVASAAAARGEEDVNDPDYLDGTPVLGREEALAFDAKTIAEEEGLSLEVVLDRFDLQIAVDDVIAAMPEDAMKTSYASHMMVHEATKPGAAIFFKGDVPPEVEQLVDKAGLIGVELRGGFKYTLDELVQRQTQAHYAVVALGFTNVYSTIDIQTQAVTVEVALSSDKPELSGKALRDAIIGELDKAPPAERARFDANELQIVQYPVGTRLVELAHGYGGAGLSDDGVRECTSAFVVRRSSDSIEGILTAAHCEGINQIEQNNANGGVDLTFSAPWKGEHIGNWGDVEWHSTTHDDFPEFWSDVDQRRTVSSRIANNQIGVNDVVCKYGRFGGRDCGSVDAINTLATFEWLGSTVTAENMVDARSIVGNLGDSGGPIYYGSQAWGVTHGWRTSNNNWVFSKIQNAESAFGVFVQTG